MYTSYFGLSEKPFNATPDPRFFYTNRGYQEAYATLLYGIRERKGFIVLTGEVGTGKTTLLRRLMDNLNPSVRVVFFYNTTLTFDEMVEFICGELQLAVSGLARVAQLQALNAFLLAEAQQGRSVLLLIDEAQNLSAETLENVRLISNLETPTSKLLQIVLVGQPELEVKLDDPALRQVTQRIGIRYRLERLTDAEVERFIDHRLRLVGRRRQDLFTDDAIRKLVPYVSGLPRLINVVCDNALLLAYAADAKRVTGRMIEEVACDLRLKRPVSSTRSPRLAQSATPPVHALPPQERRGHERAAAGSRTVSSASHRPSDWVRVATVTGFIGIVVAGIAGPLGLAWHLLWPGSLVDRTLPWSRQISLAIGGTDVPRPEQPVAVPAPRAPAPAFTSEPAALVVPGASPVQTAVAPLLDAESTSAPRPGQPPEPAATASKSPVGGREPRSARGTEAGGRHLKIPRGGTVSEVAFAHYGGYSWLALDLIQELNPRIPDIDVVAAGQPLWLPPLTLDARLRHKKNGSYRLIVTSQPSFVAAERIAASIRLLGYAAEISTREIGSNNVLHRVEIVNLKRREAAVRAWETVGRQGWPDLEQEATLRR